MITDERERPLLQPKLGAFLDPYLRPFGVAAEGGEDGDVGIDPQRVVAPVAGGDHPAIEIEELRRELKIVKTSRQPQPKVKSA